MRVSRGLLHGGRARHMRGGRRRARRADERGAILVVAGVALTGLLAVSALVVDIANASQTRRQAQASADAAALAGAQDLPNAVSVVATVKAYAQKNYGTPSSAWVGCSDAQALAVRPDTTNSDTCISIDNSYSRVRVLLPRKAVSTTFGRVLGKNALNVTASATAEALLTKADRIIPAAVTSGMGTGRLCIENSGNNTPCGGSTTGNFGSLDSPRLNFLKPSSNEDPNSLRTNYAMSLDHEVLIYNGGTRVCDGTTRTPCTATNSGTLFSANHMNVYTGNAVPPVTEGFISGFTINTTDQGSVSFCGRLARPDTTPVNISQPKPGGTCTPGGPTINVLGTTINGRHISYWMTPTARAMFYPEVTDFTKTVTSTQWAAGDARLDCFLDGYRYDYATRVETLPACPGVTYPNVAHIWPIFGKDMIADARFGMIPVVDNWSNGGSQALPITRFWAMFVYGLNYDSTKLLSVDAWVWEPALIATASGEPDLQFGFQGNDPLIHLVQ